MSDEMQTAFDARMIGGGIFFFWLIYQLGALLISTIREKRSEYRWRKEIRRQWRL